MCLVFFNKNIYDLCYYYYFLFRSISYHTLFTRYGLLELFIDQFYMYNLYKNYLFFTVFIENPNPNSFFKL